MSTRLPDYDQLENDIVRRQLTDGLREALDRNFTRLVDAARAEWERNFTGPDASDACVSVRIRETPAPATGVVRCAGMLPPVKSRNATGKPRPRLA